MAVNRFSQLSITELSDEEKQTLVTLAIRILSSRHRRGRTIKDPQDTRNYAQLLLAERKNEVFCVLFLDNQHRVIRFEEMFFGTIDGASVHPRVIVGRSLELNAAAIGSTAIRWSSST